MSRKKEPEAEPRAKGAVSRRGFIRGAGLGTGAIGTGILQDAAAQPQPPAGAKVLGPGPVAITLHVNGKTHTLSLEPRVTLLDALRNHLDYTGAKKVCDRASCGACTVILDGKAVYACSVLAIDAQGKRIQTVESLTEGGKQHALVTAFVRNDALQCGFCTPGFVMASKAYLEKTSNPTLEDLKHGLGGNICRCGTYMGIRQAVLEASRELKGGKNA